MDPRASRTPYCILHKRRLHYGARSRIRITVARKGTGNMRCLQNLVDVTPLPEAELAHIHKAINCARNPTPIRNRPRRERFA
jgi:hypothetical protein